MSKAYFSCAGQSISVVVVGYSTTLGTQLLGSQLRDSRQNYPVRARQGSLSLKLQMRGYEEQVSLADFFRGSHLLSAARVDPLVRFTYPELGMDYLGYIPDIPAGLTTGNFFPTVTVTMSLASDLLMGRTYTSSWGTSWDKVTGGKVNIDRLRQKDASKKSSSKDKALENNPPEKPPAYLKDWE